MSSGEIWLSLFWLGIALIFIIVKIVANKDNVTNFWGLTIGIELSIQTLINILWGCSNSYRFFTATPNQFTLNVLSPLYWGTKLGAAYGYSALAFMGLLGMLTFNGICAKYVKKFELWHYAGSFLTACICTVLGEWLIVYGGAVILAMIFAGILFARAML